MPFHEYNRRVGLSSAVCAQLRAAEAAGGKEKGKREKG